MLGSAVTSGGLAEGLTWADVWCRLLWTVWPAVLCIWISSQIAQPMRFTLYC